MKKQYKIFVFLLLFMTINSYGQVWNWAIQSIDSHNTGYNLTADIIVDSSKNSYIVGQFDSPLNFGTIHLVPYLKDIFVAKFDSLGTCMWAKDAGAFNVSDGTSIAIDENQDLIITGLYYGSANFDTFTINSNGESDIFIAKINSNGVWQWVKSYGGGSYDMGLKVTTDLHNNIYLTGISVDAFAFDTCHISSLGGYDAFVAKFTTSGQCIWAKNTIGAGNEEGTCISISPLGSIYVGGVYSGNPIIFGDTLNAIGQIDQYDFISKLDTNGNGIWTKQLSCGAINN